MGRNRPAPKAPPPPSPSSSSSSSSSDDDDDEERDTMEVSPSSKPAPPPTKNPPKEPSAGSGEEEEDDEDDDSGEEDLAPKTQTQLPPPPPLKPTAEPSSDSGSEESDSGSGEDDSESEPEEAQAKKTAPSAAAPDPSIKPISSKPMDEHEPTKPKKPTAAPTETDKKKRKAPEPETGDQKKPAFQRIFSLEDEIAILKGVAEYRAKKGIVPSPASHMGEFLDFVQPSLSITISKSQLSEKVRRLKKKFENAGASAKKGFRSPDEQTAYEISKGIWGKTGGGGETDDDGGDNAHPEMKSQKTVAGERASRATLENLKKAVLRMDNGIQKNLVAMRSLETVDGTKARVLEEKLKKQKVGELKHHLQRMELIKESVKAVTDGLAKSG